MQIGLGLVSKVLGPGQEHGRVSVRVVIRVRLRLPKTLILVHQNAPAAAVNMECVAIQRKSLK